MALKCGIIGLTNIGKTTLFNCISPSKGEITSYAFSTNKSNLGVVSVPDNRLEKLKEVQVSEKIIPVTVDIIDVPGLTKGASQGEGVGTSFLTDIRNCDALIHVVRCFDDENLPHVDETIDPVRDRETVDLELQVKDIEAIVKKIQRLEKMAKAGDKDAKKGIEILNIYKNHIEELNPARTTPVKDDDRIYVADLYLFTDKPVIYVCNVDDDSAATGNKYVEAFKESVKDEEAEVLVIAGSLEADIAELETVEEQKEFLEDVGLTEPSVNILIRSAYEILNLISFFTVGPKEIHAWTLRKGKTAPNAAGVIHSDLERGFIRAEVMKYIDFVELGSENACKEKGKFNVEGKTYIVEDGDILNIRFNI